MRGSPPGLALLLRVGSVAAATASRATTASTTLLAGYAAATAPQRRGGSRPRVTTAPTTTLFARSFTAAAAALPSTAFISHVVWGETGTCAFSVKSPSISLQQSKAKKPYLKRDQPGTLSARFAPRAAASTDNSNGTKYDYQNAVTVDLNVGECGRLVCAAEESWTVVRNDLDGNVSKTMTFSGAGDGQYVLSMTGVPMRNVDGGVVQIDVGVSRGDLMVCRAIRTAAPRRFGPVLARHGCLRPIIDSCIASRGRRGGEAGLHGTFAFVVAIELPLADSCVASYGRRGRTY
jgi:hypothetical protein